MKKIITVLCLTVLCALLLTCTTLAVTPAPADAESGSCGPELLWTLTDDGTLTITGKGRMYDYKTNYAAPWSKNDSAAAQRIRTVVMDDAVTHIGAYAFSGCSSLERVEFPGSLVDIGFGAFRHAAMLQQIILPPQLETIGRNAFEFCANLTDVQLPQSLRTIGGDAFSQCQSLADITLPDGITSIGFNAFNGTALATNDANYDGVFLYIGSYLVEKKWVPLTDFVTCAVKDGTTLIADSLFSTELYLKEITLPDSLRYVGDAAFSNCSSLKDVTFTGTETQWHTIICGTKNLSLLLADIHCKDADGNALTLSPVPTTETDSTCRVPGTKNGKQCSSCGLILVEPERKPLLKHDWEIISNEGATCVKRGTLHLVCKQCGMKTTKSKVLAPDVHEHMRKIRGKQPTCAKRTYTDGIYCDDCKKFISGHALQPRPKHVLERSVRPATLQDGGIVTYTCKVCGARTEKTFAGIDRVRLSGTVFAKTGKKITPTVIVKDTMNRTLKKGKAYTVQYAAGRKNFGVYQVTVTFIGNYAGSKTLQFKIVPAAPETVTATAARQKVTLRWTAVPGAEKYLIYYKDKPDGPFKKIGSATGTTWTSKTLPKDSDLWFAVRAVAKRGGVTLSGACTYAAAVKVV